MTATDSTLFGKLMHAKRGRIPHVQQLHATDCGAASLTMTLAFHGKVVPLDDVRHAMGAGRDGVSAHAIAVAAEGFGLNTRGITLDTEDLSDLPPGSILHWEFRHFVVFESATRKGVRIIDPAGGRRLLSHERFSKSFTGVALVCEPSQEFEPGGTQKQRALSYLRQFFGQGHLIWRVVMTSVLLRIFALSIPILMAMIVDRVVPRGDSELLSLVAWGLLAMVAFQFLSELIRAHLLLQLRTNLDTRMTLGFLRHLLSLPYHFFQLRQAGDLMMRVNSNATIRELLTANTLTALLDGTLVFFYLIAILMLAPTIAGIVLLFGCVQAGLFVFARARIHGYMAEQLEAQARSQSYLVQVIQGVETLKTSGAEGQALRRWSNLFVDELNAGLRRGRLDALVDAVMAALRLAAPLAILTYGATLVVAQEMTLGTMLAVNALALAFLTPLAALVNSAFQLQLLSGYFERLDDVLSASPEQEKHHEATPTISGSVQLDRISFQYGPNLPEVVQKVTLSLKPGSCTAIVGRSGSGKSTLASLIMGLHKPTGGRIMLDKRSLWDCNLQSIRRQLGIVPQSPYIFGSNIRENIALMSPEASLEDVVSAAKRACIHDEVIAMPMAYESVITDGGASLSGGQRQRIALARALVHEPALLLLDEATSALDAATERAVMDNLAQLHCTRVIVAHRLSTISFADTIVVMAQGRIVEQGTHTELMAGGGYYADMVNTQRGSYDGDQP
ncbi:MAG: peptidase domain-containing ABC transporter [Myxococcales bacterium]|nr:peptidase domain-containing ABC transporter [Myxococcales bacterium]